MHLILLGVLFLCDTGKFHQERFVIDTTKLQSTVVFMPLKKRVVDQNTTSSVGQTNNNRKVISYDAYEKKVAAKKLKNKKVVKQNKTIVKKKSPLKPAKSEIVKPTTQAATKKNSPTKLQQDQQSSVAKKTAAKLAADKAKILAAQKKAALEKADKEKKDQAAKLKKAAADKSAVAQAIADKKAAEAKKIADEILKKTIEAKVIPEIEKQVDIVKKETIEIVPEHSIAQELVEVLPDKNKKNEQVVEPIDNEEKTLQISEEQQDEEDVDDDLDLDNISFVGSRDLEMMHIKEKIQREIVKYYKPPVGIAKKAVCELTVVVGVDGKATRVTVKKGSGSMANDMCARAAVLKVLFPREVIGKEITVALGQ